MNVTEMLIAGLQIGALDESVARYGIDVETNCALTGERIAWGIPVRRVVSSNTGEFLDLTSGQVTGYVSENSARAFKGACNMGSIIVFADGTHYHPLISATSAAAATPSRPCWSVLVRELWPERQGQECLIILATDVKKKVWPLAQVGHFGVHTPVLLFDSSRDLLGVCPVHWPGLLSVLNLVEELYQRGFTKNIIADNLYIDLKTMEEVGYTQTMDYERRLRQIRHTAEFKMSIIIAQKGV